MAKFILSAFADEAAESLDGQIEALLSNGIYQIEPRNIDKKGILDLSEEELTVISQKLKDNGIGVYSLGSPIGKYPIDEPFEVHIDAFAKALRACQILGAKNMRMFSFFVEQADLAKYRDTVLQRMSTLLALAKCADVRLCHENESRIYGQMPEEVNDLVENLPGLYMIFDPANYRMNDGDIDAGIQATLKRLGYLHIKDAIFETQTIVPAGEGEGKIEEVLALVDKVTDDVITLTLEPHLFAFEAYKSIDEHELRGTHHFESATEAFAFAVTSLKNILIKLGYHEGDDHIWKK
ncbi:MAG: sugar phosphate isomerase/epimerase [Clostridia bacterium]|nr:sugar phosphate isomerase/epimerase [Clostridia bacterium]